MTRADAVSILQPQDALIVAAALAGFKGAGDLCVAEANAYLANPGASTLQLLQAAVVAFEQQINASLLAAARIVDTKSQQMVIAALDAAGTAINAVLALIAGIKGNTLTATAASLKAPIKLNKVRRFYDPNAVNMEIAVHYGLTQQYAGVVVQSNTQMLMAMGF
jgi:multisubunit Na+/H+ antiporter MnhF subunit